MNLPIISSGFEMATSVRGLCQLIGLLHHSGVLISCSLEISWINLIFYSVAQLYLTWFIIFYTPVKLPVRKSYLMISLTRVSLITTNK